MFKVVLTNGFSAAGRGFRSLVASDEDAAKRVALAVTAKAERSGSLVGAEVYAPTGELIYECGW